MMAYILSQRDGRPIQQVPIVGANQQWQGLDARTSTSHADEPRTVRRRSPTPERGRASSIRSSPLQKVQRQADGTADIEAPPSMGASSSSQPERSQLEHLLDDVKEPPENPGRKLAELMEKKRKDPIARDRSRSTARDNANISIAFIARLDEDAKEAISRYDEYVAFWNERSIFNMKEINAKMQKKQALEKRGKLLKYGKQSLETQTLLDASRLTECERYKKFGAVSVISEKEALQLIAAGAECLPMQWIELYKNAAKRTVTNPLPPAMRSRMVARGDLESQTTRTDSPTVSDEAVLMICSWAASFGILLRMCDLESGYFQGIKLWYTLVLKQPRTALATSILP